MRPLDLRRPRAGSGGVTTTGLQLAGRANQQFAHRRGRREGRMPAASVRDQGEAPHQLLTPGRRVFRTERLPHGDNGCGAPGGPVGHVSGGDPQGVLAWLEVCEGELVDCAGDGLGGRFAGSPIGCHGYSMSSGQASDTTRFVLPRNCLSGARFRASAVRMAVRASAGGTTDWAPAPRHLSAWIQFR